MFAHCYASSAKQTQQDRARADRDKVIAALQQAIAHSPELTPKDYYGAPEQRPFEIKPHAVRGRYAAHENLAGKDIGELRNRDVAIKRFEEYVRNIRPRSTASAGCYEILALYAAPGLGKSRMLDEMAHREDDFWRAVGAAPTKFFLPLLVSFSGAVDVRLKEPFGLLFRMTMTYFVGFPGVFDGFQSFAERVQRVWPAEVEFVRLLDAIEFDFVEARRLENPDREIGPRDVKVMFLIDEMRCAGEGHGADENNDAVRSVYNRVCGVLSSRRGACFSALDVTTLGRSGMAASGRVITFLPLPTLNVSDWFREYFVPLVDEMRPRVLDRDEEEIAAKDLLRLFLLTGGRPREMQHVVAALWQTTKVGCTWRDIVTTVSKAAPQPPEDQWRECLFSALTNVKLPLEVSMLSTGVQHGKVHQQIPSEFAVWILCGAAVNYGYGQTAPEVAPPIVSLYRLLGADALQEDLPTLTNLLELLARRETDGHIFERLWQLHTALLLQIHQLIRDGLSLKLPRLLESRIPLPRTVNLLSIDSISPLSLFNKVKIVRQQLPALDELHVDAQFNEMSLNGTLDCEGFNLWTATTSQLLLKFDHVLVNLHEKNETFDSALLVKQVTDDENGIPHLLCFENKLRSDSVRLRDLKSKVDLFDKHLDKLVSEAGADTALRAAGLHQKQQFTLMFVVHGKVNDKVIGALERYCVKTPFNVVLMDEDAVIAHFGASFEPCVWLCKTIASNEE